MTRHPLLAIIAGFLFWSGLFLLLYGVQSTGCYLAGDQPSAIAGSHPALRMTLIVLACAGTGAVVLLLLKDRHLPPAQEDTASFTREISRYVWIAAAVTTPFCFSGVLFLTLCGT
jgi:hypothetical protein